MDFGKLHLVVLHFPIALIAATAVAEFLGLFGRKVFFQNASLFCLIGALLTAPIAVATGWDFLGDLQFTGRLANLAAWHRALGIATLVLVVAAAVVRLARVKRPAQWQTVACPVLVVAMAAAVAVTGYLGGLVAFP